MADHETSIRITIPMSEKRMGPNGSGQKEQVRISTDTSKNPGYIEDKDITANSMNVRIE